MTFSHYLEGEDCHEMSMFSFSGYMIHAYLALVGSTSYVMNWYGVWPILNFLEIGVGEEQWYFYICWWQKVKIGKDKTIGPRKARLKLEGRITKDLWREVSWGKWVVLRVEFLQMDVKGTLSMKWGTQAEKSERT